MRGGSPGAVELVEEEAFDRFGRLVSIEATIFNSKLLHHRVGQIFDVIRHFSKSPDNRPDNLSDLVVGIELCFEVIARITSPCIQRVGPGMIVRVDFSGVR